MRFFALLFLLVPYLGFSQVEIKAGKGLTEVKADYNDYHINGNQYYRISMKGNLIKLRKYDINTLEVLSFKEFEVLPKEYKIKASICLKDKAFIFYTVSGQQEVLATSVDLQNESIISKGVSVIKPNSRLVETYRGGDYYYKVSADSSKFLIYYDLVPAIKDDKLNHAVKGLFAFDLNLKPLFSKELSMPHTEDKLHIISTNIDSDGAPYLLTSLKEESLVEKGKYSLRLQILKVDIGTGQINAIELDNKGKYPLSVKVAEGNNGNLVVANYYSIKRDKDLANGILVYKIDKNRNVTSLSNYDVPLEICNQFLSEKEQEKNKEKGFGNISNMNLIQLTVESDGSVFLLGEQLYQEWGQVDGRDKLFEYFDDLLAVKIDPSNNLSWMKKMAKRQLNKNISIDLLSVNCIKSNGSYYLMYFDNKKNLELGINDIPTVLKNEKDGTYRAYKINSKDGKVEQFNLFDRKDIAGKEIPWYNVNSTSEISNIGMISESYTDTDKCCVLIKVKLK